MAINWIFALKAVPWADLVQAAPHIVKGARRLFNTARSSEPPPVGSADAGADTHAETVPARLRRIESALQALDTEQQSSAELIRSLAEQNARVVQAIEVLRARMRLLLGVCVGLTVVAVASLAWMLTR
jgi:hypothetical protein